MDEATKLVRNTELHTYTANDMVVLASTESTTVIGRMIRGKAESFDSGISDDMIKSVIAFKLVNKFKVYTKILSQTLETMELHGVEAVVEVQHE